MLSFKWEYDHQGPSRSGTLVGRRLFCTLPLCQQVNISWISSRKRALTKKITRIIRWSQLVKRSTGTVVLSSPCWCHSNFYEPALLQLCFICWLQKRKEKKGAQFLLGFFIGYKSFQKKAFFKLLTTNPRWSLICVQRWNLYLLLWLFGLRSCEQVVELFFGRRCLFELFGVPHLVCLGVFGVPRLVLVQAQMGATRKPHNRWGLFGEDTFNASSEHQANIGHIRI